MCSQIQYPVRRNLIKDFRGDEWWIESDKDINYVIIFKNNLSIMDFPRKPYFSFEQRLRHAENMLDLIKSNKTP